MSWRLERYGWDHSTFIQLAQATEQVIRKVSLQELIDQPHSSKPGTKTVRADLLRKEAARFGKMWAKTGEIGVRDAEGVLRCFITSSHLYVTVPAMQLSETMLQAIKGRPFHQVIEHPFFAEGTHAGDTLIASGLSSKGKGDGDSSRYGKGWTSIRARRRLIDPKNRPPIFINETNELYNWHPSEQWGAGRRNSKGRTIYA